MSSSELSISPSVDFSANLGEGVDCFAFSVGPSSFLLGVVGLDAPDAGEPGGDVLDGSARRALEGEEIVTLSELLADLLRRDRELRRERLGSEIFFLVLESDEAVLGEMPFADLLGLRCDCDAERFLEPSAEATLRRNGSGEDSLAVIEGGLLGSVLAGTTDGFSGMGGVAEPWEMEGAEEETEGFLGIGGDIMDAREEGGPR